LIPHNLEIVPMEDVASHRKMLQFHGENLRAVNSVHLVPQDLKSPSLSPMRVVSGSMNVMEIDATNLNPGTYNIQVGIGDGTVDDIFVDLVNVGKDGTERPQTLTIPALPTKANLARENVVRAEGESASPITATATVAAAPTVTASATVTTSAGTT